MCGVACGKAAAAVKKHYKDKHNCNVTISTTQPTPVPCRQTSPRPAPSSPLTEDIDMEDADAVGPSLAAPFLDTGAGGDSPDPQSDEDDEWDMESVLSDASTEILLNEDEDDVVPRSFNFSIPADPSAYGAHLKLSEQLPELSPSSEEELPPPSANVYGSDSEYLDLLHP